MGNISGMVVDVLNRKIFKGTVEYANGKIADVREEDPAVKSEHYILPGFVDAHIHIESSMLVPYEFARIALQHGTVATVSDPHEIANVCGTRGVLYMIENARDARLKFHFGAPSCVPATAFETSGAALNAEDVGNLLSRPDIYYLSEMMNYPGVLNDDPQVVKKIEAARRVNKPVDGHAPGLRGADALKYIHAGITTDHECVTKEEALEKIKYGMNIIIREGSAAKNFEALHELISEHPARVMFCSDDKHPDDLLEGHINQLAARAVSKGHDVMDVLRCACVNPVVHYNLPVGLFRKGDPADFIVVQDLKEFRVLFTCINGEIVADGRRGSILNSRTHRVINRFECNLKKPDDFVVKANREQIHVIEALDGQLITNDLILPARQQDGNLVADVEADVLKLAVVNRYQDARPAIGFIKNFGLKTGALASTVAHDSHNIIAAGVSDDLICRAVNVLIREKGGLAFVNDKEESVLPLPVAGLMTTHDGNKTAAMYKQLDRMVKDAGCRLKAPFMTLSFMALLVIPDLKLSDKGLFSGKRFEFISL